jgi:hypothetical protein
MRIAGSTAHDPSPFLIADSNISRFRIPAGDWKHIILKNLICIKESSTAYHYNRIIERVKELE